MPCNCDYMEPSPEEIRLSKIACLIDELDGKPINKNYWDGYHPRVYSQTYDRYNDPPGEDSFTTELLQRLKGVNIKRCSLEMQIWWRDRQTEIKKKEKENKHKAQREKEIQTAKNKLTKRERKLLNLE